MMFSLFQNSKSLFNEVAIANLGHFQIAILSTTKIVNRRIFSAQVAVPERRYHSQGALIYDQQDIACLDALELGAASSDDSPLKPIRRLAPSIPISFQVKSSQPLPNQVSSQSTFACELSNTDFPYRTIFRQIQPRFVRVYPFESNNSLIDKVEQMLTDEAAFISENYGYLKRVPFYQKHFGL